MIFRKKLFQLHENFFRTTSSRSNNTCSRFSRKFLASKEKYSWHCEQAKIRKWIIKQRSSHGQQNKVNTPAKGSASTHSGEFTLATSPLRRRIHGIDYLEELFAGAKYKVCFLRIILSLYLCVAMGTNKFSRQQIYQMSSKDK